jgi:hypothetical protein
MIERIQEACGQAFVDFIEAQFEEQRARAIETYGAETLPYLIAESPCIAIKYAAVDDGTIAVLKLMACRALERRVQFRQARPPWAPDLPIDYADCVELEGSTCARMQCVGEYGSSLLISGWDPAHPFFDDYCRETGPGRYWHQDETIPKFMQFLHRVDAGITATEERCRRAADITARLQS